MGSKVTIMEGMLEGAAAFNQPLSFDTSKVTIMEGMFYEAAAFNQPLSFVTSEVTTMEHMFANAMALSDANKHLIRCAWEGTEAFDDQYDDWNEASFIMKDQGSTKCAAGTELTESECEAHAGAVAGLTYKNKIIQGEVSLYPSGCWEYSDQGNLLGTVYFNEAPSSHQVTSASAAPICKRVCE